MSRFLCLVIYALIIFIILFKTTVFGWRASGRAFMNNSQDNPQLEERLRSHVYQLAHEIGDRSVFKYNKLKEAANYISGQFKSYGWEPEFQDFIVYNQMVSNVVAAKSAEEHAAGIIIVGAHYDTCSNPGADDNASGIAVLLELTRLFKDKQANCPVKFVAFVNEEPPFFKSEDMGSRFFARKAKSEKENIKAVLILESVGYFSDKPRSQAYPLFFGPFYPNKGNFIGMVSSFGSCRLLAKIKTILRNQAGIPVESVVAPAFVEGIDFSDHWSFWKEGYPALMFTDTAFYRNPNYHTLEDTYEKLDYRSMAKLTEELLVVLTELKP